MLGIVLRVIALLCFVLAGANQTIFTQPPADLVAFGLAFWVAATLIGGYDFGGRFNRAA